MIQQNNLEEKMLHKKLGLIILLGFGILLNAQQNIGDYGKSQFFLGAEANLLSRTAFTHPATINSNDRIKGLENANNGIYPQDSFAYTSLKFYGDYDYNISDEKKLKVSLGYFGGVAYTYNGAYPAPDDTRKNNPEAIEFHRFLFYRAFIGYDDPNNFVRLGRFIIEDDDWIKSTGQGGEYIYSNDNFLVKLLAVSDLTTAFGAWVWDFQNKSIPNGLYHISLEYHTQDKKIRIRPYLYSVPEYYTIPGFSIKTSVGDKNTFLWYTYITASYERFHDKAYSPGTKLLFPYVSPGKDAGNIYILQSFSFLKDYQVQLSYFKNFGNFNAMLGTYGNPGMVGIYDNSYYANLWLSDFLAKDSQSFLVNATTTLVKNTVLGLFYRGTWSYRSTENTAGILASYDWTPNVTLKGVLAYYLDETFQGYNSKFWVPTKDVPATARGPITKTDTPKNFGDRSYFMFNLIVRL